MYYLEVSIRVTLPEEIRSVIMKEKMRFVAEYGSPYKSEPHVTLYLGRYTEEGFPKLMADLEKLELEPTSFTLLGVRRDSYPANSAGNWSYTIEVSNHEELTWLHTKVSSIATKYQSPLLREKDLERLERGIVLTPGQYMPHITLGGIPPTAPQPDLEQVEENVKTVIGKKVDVSDMTVFYYGREKVGDETKIFEKIKVDF